jgi:ethanolamine phosphate transferase 2 subunit G
LVAISCILLLRNFFILKGLRLPSLILDGYVDSASSLIRSGAAIPFDGHASPPTITMPRVKAITTGSVPSFLDVVLNFAESDTTSTLAQQDSWLAQSKVKPDGKLLMYGDDTWIKLFPGFFDRADGTTSFFVSDFTEVDQNVTRHISRELAETDWSVMILHYLGLDHIGHKAGPRSIHMAPKQSEMDNVVERIYREIETTSHLSSTLLVLSGDHGMNEAGNHGGSSSGEVTTALTFISPKFKVLFDGFDSPRAGGSDFTFYDKVDQSDITPTLATLLGFPIPVNSLGVVISKLLDVWSTDSDKLCLLYANARQIAGVANATYSEAFEKYSSRQQCLRDVPEAGVLPCAWLEVQQAMEAGSLNGTVATEAMGLTMAFLKTAQYQLSGTASNYDLARMAAGTTIAMAAVSLALLSTALVSVKWTVLPSIFLLVVFAHSITMFASSYVEEEHQFWYWALGAWLMYLTIKEQRLMDIYFEFSQRKVFLPVTGLLFGILRRVNSTGQKFAALPSVTSTIFPSETWLLWSLIVLAYALVTRNLSRRASTWGGAGSSQLTILPIPVCLAAFLFKVAFTHAESPELLQSFMPLKPLVALTSHYSLVALARVVFLGIAYLFACSLYYEAPWAKREPRNQSRATFLHTLHTLLSLFLMTQSRASNIPIFLLYSLQLSCLCVRKDLFSNLTEITLTSLLVQQAAFFASGGSNAISSVDLSNSYNGVSDYNVVLVGILTFVNNWAGPIWWTSGTALLIVEGASTQVHPGDHPGAEPKPVSEAGDRSRPTTNTATRGKNFGSPYEAFSTYFALMTVFATVSTSGVMIACTILREHLFIWTVFSPKYLYTGAWSLGHHFFVSGIFAWVLLGNVLIM